MGLELNYCVIPRIVTTSGVADIRYTMFITSKRIAFIKTGKSYETLGLGLGGIVGYGLGKLSGEEKPSIKDGDIDKLLSQDKSNFEIPLERLKEIKLRKEMAGKYRIIIYGLNKKNKKRKLLNGYFDPDLKLYENQIRKGLRTDEALRLYVLDCQEKLVFWLEDLVTEKFDVSKIVVGLKQVSADQL